MDESCFLNEKGALCSFTCEGEARPVSQVSLAHSHTVKERDAPAPGPPKTKITVTSFLSNALSPFFSSIPVTVTGAILFKSRRYLISSRRRTFFLPQSRSRIRCSSIENDGVAVETECEDGDSSEREEKVHSWFLRR